MLRARSVPLNVSATSPSSCRHHRRPPAQRVRSSANSGHCDYPAQGPSWVNSGRLSPTEDLVHRRVFDLKGRLKAPATRVSAAKSLVRLKPH